MRYVFGHHVFPFSLECFCKKYLSGGFHLNLKRQKQAFEGLSLFKILARFRGILMISSNIGLNIPALSGGGGGTTEVLPVDSQQA